ncbi:hypothetical protein FH972_021299 [Carpinus fangiana]|uniref:Prenyltransferase alpha-alpha toroid domain-containing protein n=1 Tax=Carpinus fangiana TaxID=176857 RepID=A0A5N6KPI8_9ROSI|nr:hypothetical protein FH972_021299 [Carpinus fangiana]
MPLSMLQSRRRKKILFRPKSSSMSAIAAHPEESQQQGWAEWWHQHHTAPTINTSTHTAKPLTTKLPRYRPNLDDALAEDSGPAWHLNRDRLLNFARRGAWMVENLPPTDEAVLRRWKETIEAAAPAPLISLTTTNIVQNMSDAIKADTGSWPMQSHSFGTQLDTPSLLLMRQTHTECSEAISEYLDAHEGLDLPWTQQRGLALTSENDHSDLPGLQKQKHFNFLSRLLGRLPGGFRKLDASRPWMFYWVLNSFATMNIDFKSSEE